MPFIAEADLQVRCPRPHEYVSTFRALRRSPNEMTEVDKGWPTWPSHSQPCPSSSTGASRERIGDRFLYDQTANLPTVKKRDNYYAKLDAKKYGKDAVPTSILQESVKN